MNLAEFEKIMKNVPDDRFNEGISKGALKLSDEQVATVSFIFWITYMAEKDLGDVISTPWALIKKYAENNGEISSTKDALNKMLGWAESETKLEDVISDLEPRKQAEILKSVKENYRPKRKPGIENLEYFIDKIRIHEAFFGDNERTKLYWKLNGLRNKISHGDIEGFGYNEQDLTQRPTREALLMDYLRTGVESDTSKSKLWNSLSENEKAEIKRKNREILQKEGEI